MDWLEGKAALLTGAGAGIGRAVVDAFVSEGARVAVLERDAGRCSELRKAHEGRIIVIEGDATVAPDNAAAVRAAVVAFGHLDALVTFVGVFDYYTSLARIPEEALDTAFDQVFTTNVKSCLLAVRAALPELERVRGSVTLTLSTSSFYPGRGGTLYVASKFACRGLVVQLGHELAPRVRVNAVAPGGTLDTALAGVPALGLSDRRLGDAMGREQELADRSPLGTALRPEDHAGAYVLLASDRARGITGAVVNSDGGAAVRG